MIIPEITHKKSFDDEEGRIYKNEHTFCKF